MSGSSSKPTQQEAVRRWSAAEQRLYPALVGSPAGYDRYVTLVRRICDELGSVRDIESLVDAYNEGLDVAAAAARDRELPLEGLDIDLVVGAAFCLRYREVLAETRRAEIRQRVEQARDRGDRWVTLEGTRPWLEMPFPPWRSIEMHLPEGTGIHAWAEESPDDTGDGIEYGIEVVRLDPRTGSWLAGEPATERQTFNDHSAWQQAIVALKRRYDGFKPFDSAREMGG